MTTGLNRDADARGRHAQRETGRSSPGIRCPAELLRSSQRTRGSPDGPYAFPRYSFACRFLPASQKTTPAPKTATATATSSHTPLDDWLEAEAGVVGVQRPLNAAQIWP